MQNEITAILVEHGIHTDQVVHNGQTAQEYLEGAILGAIEIIEDGE